MAASARRRFYSRGLRLPFGLFFLDPRFPVSSGSSVLAGKPYRDNLRVRNMAGGAVPFDIHLKIRGLGVRVSVEDVPFNTLTGLYMNRNITAVMKGLFNHPADFFRRVGRKRKTSS